MPHSVSQTLCSELPSQDDSSNSIENSKEKIYLGVDFLEVSSAAERRKPVCIISHEGKLSVRKYDHEEFEKNASFRNNQVFVNDDLVQLVVYVNKNYQRKCSEEMEKILKKSFDINDKEKIVEIKKHFRGVWKNFRNFSSYASLIGAYDAKTGNYIHNVVSDLGKIHLKMEAEYQQLNENRDVSEESNKILDEMKKILDVMKDIYEKNRTDFQHHVTNTVTGVAHSFEKLESEFDDQAKALELEKNNVKLKKQYQIFSDALIAFQAECKKPILIRCSEEIFVKKNKITEQIGALLERSEALKDCILSESEINGLQSKLDNLKIKFSNLSDTITLESINQSTQKDIPQTKSLFKELKVLLAEIEAHKTDGNKEKLKGDLIQEIKNVLEVQDNNSIEALSKVINKTNKFIEGNKVEANAYTGGPFGKLFGKGHSVLGELMDKLQKLLDKFLHVLSLHHVSSDSNAPSMIR